jgi:transposase
VRVTTLFRRLLGITGLRVTGALFQSDGGLAIEVKPSWRRPRCGQCGRRAPAYDRRPLRWWLHLPAGATPVRLSYGPRRVDCRRCGVRSEKLPWGEAGSRFTAAFEEMVAYLAQITDLTQVARLMGISWATVGSIVSRVVARHLASERLATLRLIGIDEFSFRKHHHYLTVVVDHERRCIVWAAEGRKAETLGPFFSLLGPEGCAAIQMVSIDLAASYRKAAEENLPNAEIVFDRFHVQRLASAALDEVRRALVRELAGTPEAAVVKNTRWALLHDPANTTALQRERLSAVQDTNRSLYRAYLLKETLVRALDYLQPKRASEALNAWIAWAQRSRLRPFVRAARTIRSHLPGILAYIRTRLTNGLTEGLNAKLRMVTRRAYGYHSADALIAMLFLTCSDIRLNPPLPSPTPC